MIASKAIVEKPSCKGLGIGWTLQIQLGNQDEAFLFGRGNVPNEAEWVFGEFKENVTAYSITRYHNDDSLQVI